MADFDPASRIADELTLPRDKVAAVVRLLDDGNTIPFIARYRKEITGELDEVQIRAIHERRAYLVELDQRRGAILAAIDEQGQLTDELRRAILAAPTKAALEDLYLPFKRKRRTRAAVARERGLQPLADRMRAQPDRGDPRREAAAFVDPGKALPDVDAVLAGARDIVAETVAEQASVRALVRETFLRQGRLTSAVKPGHRGTPSKFEQYYEFSERAASIPSHRFLAILRGEAEGVLRATIAVDESRLLGRLLGLARHRPASPFASQLHEAVTDGYKRLIAPSVENDVRAELKQRSDASAVAVFAENLQNLLLAPPLGEQGVLGIDPGLRTGSKCAALDATGKFLEHRTLFLARGEADKQRAREDLLALVRTHSPAAIAVGNGTGGRETEAFVRSVIGAEGIPVVQVSEAGASVYSASPLAGEEFPELDLTVRGAISIGRRLQDPLAELVKIEPRAIGVGQYQHDVAPTLLARKLDEVVESCVNRVGVELNTASAPLLARVAGVGPGLARQIVSHREQHGAFRGRRQLLDVKRLGRKAFEQAAGFLRVRGGDHPLDASAVHPERYRLVERMARDHGVPLAELVGNAQQAAAIAIDRYVDDEVGAPTLRDIVDELKKPGRDPRQRFEPPRFRDDVQDIKDLRPGMQLEGVVTNVTGFGAFVDIGVHRDGLVHISQLADRFVRDPHEVVKVGDRLQVRVLEADVTRNRISLSAKKA